MFAFVFFVVGSYLLSFFCGVYLLSVFLLMIICCLLFNRHSCGYWFELQQGDSYIDM